MRINKYLSDSGVDSRRKADDIIVAGRVMVNGQVVTNLSTRISDGDIVELDGKQLHLVSEKIYIALNKPIGYLSANKSQNNLPIILDLTKDIKQKIYPVGRLDFNSEGLLLLTNDGDYANKVISPKFEQEKEYEVTLNVKPTSFQLNKLTSSMTINGMDLRPAKIEKVLYDRKNNIYTLNITITEGKNRQVRNMFKSIGLKVINLKRIRIGKYLLNDLPSGKYVHLTKEDLLSTLDK